MFNHTNEGVCFLAQSLEISYRSFVVYMYFKKSVEVYVLDFHDTITLTLFLHWTKGRNVIIIKQFPRTKNYWTTIWPFHFRGDKKHSPVTNIQPLYEDGVIQYCRLTMIASMYFSKSKFIMQEMEVLILFTVNAKGRSFENPPKNERAISWPVWGSNPRHSRY